MEVQGKVKAVLGAETIGANTKQTLVLTVKNGQYDNDLAIEYWNDKAQPLSNIQVGQTVVAKFDVKSREYNGKYYTNANGYYVNISDDNSTPSQTGQGMTPNQGFNGNPKEVNTNDFGKSEEEISDLPF